MARTYVRLPTWDHATFTVEGSDTVFDAYAVSVRDVVRTALDPGETNNDWIVGDVAKWTGLGNNKGYAFIVRHMNGAGTATGPEWLFILPGWGGVTTAIAEAEDILGSGVDATIDDYFIETSNTTGFGYDAAWALHYNPTGGTSTPYDGGNTWDSAGTITGGDLSAPNTSPYTGITTFLPNTTQPVGFVIRDMEATYSRVAVVLDDVAPALTMYVAEGRLNYPSTVILSGEIIVPYLSTDTYTSANLSLELNNSDSQGGAISTALISYYNGAGTKQLDVAAIEAPQYLTRFNDTYASGDYAWDTVKVITSSYFKGYLNTDLVKVVGGYNERYLELFEFDGDVQLKVEEAMAFPYTTTTPIFPAE